MYVQLVPASESQQKKKRFIWTLKAGGSSRQSLLKPGPVNCGSTPLCNVGKQTRGFQKQGDDCFEKNVSEGALAKLKLHLSR